MVMMSAESMVKSASFPVSIVPRSFSSNAACAGQRVNIFNASSRLTASSGEGWHPEEAATREQALKMFTIWPAFAAFEEKLRGSIEVGKLADFTVFSADIMKIPDAELLRTRCVMTVIGGEIVFESTP